MTFNPGIPVKTESPFLFPDQMHANLNRLQTIIEADHVFNETAQVNDGIHKQVKFLNRVAPVGSPLVNGESGIMWTQPDTMGRAVQFWYNGVNFYPLNATKALVNFNGLTLAIQTGSYNVATVTRYPGGVGRYRITYSVPFVNAGDSGKYIVQVTCMSSVHSTIGTIRRSATPNLSMTNIFVDVETVRSSNGDHIDCEYVGVSVYSII